MLNLAPWYYKKLLQSNELIDRIEYYEIDLITCEHQFEAVVFLKNHLLPTWLDKSEVYKNCDGTGTSSLKNIAVYKAISESLERLAFYELVDSDQRKYCFDVNPTTTGMAAYPFITNSVVRKNAKAEAVERWALQQFNYYKLPVISKTCKILNLNHYEIITPFNDIKVSLVSYKINEFYAYGFAGGNTLNHSFEKAIVELDRNIRVLDKVLKTPKYYNDFTNTVDRTITYFSSEEGYVDFLGKIQKAPAKLLNTKPNVICDTEMSGSWSEYTTVWRYLLDDSYHDCRNDHTFFMF